MAKETFYFSHDYEPLSDPKLAALVGEFAAAGYGLYWRIVEMLHQESEHKLPHKKYIYSALAQQMLTSVEQVEAVIKYAIEVCELFESDDEFFWSNRVYRNLDKRAEIREKRSKAGKISAEKRKKATNVEQVLTRVEHNPTPVEHNSTKERKGKESKVKEIKENKDIDLIKNEISKLSNNYAEENFRAFEKWRDYLEKQHNNFLKENIYSYQILQNAIKTIGASKFVQAVNFSIESNYKKIYPRPEARQQERVTAQAAKKDSDF